MYDRNGATGAGLIQRVRVARKIKYKLADILMFSKVPTLRQKCISSGCKGNTRNYCLIHGALCPTLWAETHFVYTKVCPVRKQ